MIHSRVRKPAKSNDHVKSGRRQGLRRPKDADKRKESEVRHWNHLSRSVVDQYYGARESSAFVLLSEAGHVYKI